MAAFDYNHRVAHGVVALLPGTTGTWDGGGVSGPGMVLKVAEGDYRMWYEGIDLATSPSTNRTGYATSTDGTTLTKYGSNPIFGPSGAGENNESSFTSVFFDTNDNAYRAYYHGGNNSGGTFGRAIFYATAPNLTNGGTWTRANSGSPVLQKGGSGAWDESGIADAKIFQLGPTDYRLWYHGWRVSDGKGQIGYATSSDGISWTKSGSNPVIALAAGTWEDTINAPAPLVFSTNEFYCWYSANDSGGKGRMGFASSTNGIAWTKSSNNPVMGNVSAGAPADSMHVYIDNPSWLRFVFGAADTTGTLINEKRNGNLRPPRFP